MLNVPKFSIGNNHLLQTLKKMLSQNETGLDVQININSDVRQIPGLTHVPDYVSIDEQNQLLNVIDQHEWSTILKRRVQHYGYRYDYKKGVLASSSYLGALPDWAQSIANKVVSDRLTSNLPDQVIVNEYEPGQDITSHIDCFLFFVITIISLRL